MAVGDRDGKLEIKLEVFIIADACGVGRRRPRISGFAVGRGWGKMVLKYIRRNMASIIDGAAVGTKNWRLIDEPSAAAGEVGEVRLRTSLPGLVLM